MHFFANPKFISSYQNLYQTYNQKNDQDCHGYLKHPGYASIIAFSINWFESFRQPKEGR